MFHASLSSARTRVLALIAAAASLPAFVVAPLSAYAATNTAPTISGTPATTATVGTTYAFLPTAADADGQKLTYKIANKPAWMWFSNKTGQLSGTPKKAQSGRTFSGIRISVTDGKATTSLPAFAIKVVAASTSTNRVPTISGTPVTTATAGNPYSWKPTATDADGDALTFSITGKPAWASFDTSNGTLYGTPGAASTGTYSSIVIKVSDGKATASLPAFAITVVAATTNRAPTISGTPVATATIGKPYAWKPTATDADGDALTFSISGKPAWAAFDTSNGTLYGTPGADSAGTYSNIAIKVSDGTETTSLPAFAITVSAAPTQSVTLNWSKPTTNVDGTALTNLSGYTVSYGNAPGSYSTSLTLTGAAITSVVIEGLSAGKWYFAIKSRNTTGVESEYSGEVVAAL